MYLLPQEAWFTAFTTINKKVEHIADAFGGNDSELKSGSEEAPQLISPVLAWSMIDMRYEVCTYE